MGITKITICATLCSIMGFATCTSAGMEKAERPTPRKSLYYMDLGDGWELSIRSPALYSYEKPQTLQVRAMLVPGGDLLKSKWVADKITTIDFPAKSPWCHALVHVKENRIFIFFTWNNQYCVIDKKDGTILKQGRGEEVLKQYDQFVVLKLIQPSTWGKIEEGK